MPTLNEEEGIQKTISSIPVDGLKKLGFDIEILVVDGSSTDNTVIMALEFGARVINSERGYGRQYKNGFKAAKGDIIITGDSDGTYPFEEIVEYLKIFETKNLEFLTVNRFAGMDNDAMYLSNKIGNFFLTLFTNILFNFQIKDSQSGMWIIKKSSLPTLRVQSDGMPFSQEIKIEAFTKLKSLEIPGSYKKRLGSTKLSKINDGIRNLFWLFRKKFAKTPQAYSLG
jgi:glycosyltransferase involved in cell wall biosynthesis